MSNLNKILTLIESIKSATSKSNHRQMIMLHGGMTWTHGVARKIDTNTSALWLGEKTFKGDQRNQLRRFLGQEHGLIIYNLFNGFDPELLAAVSGTLRGGGLFILLAPPVNEWLTMPDPEQERIAVYPYSNEQLGHGFIQRLQRILSQHPGCLTIHEEQPLPGYQAVCDESRSSHIGTEDQAQAVQQIVTSTNSDPIVITADRGRGKSAALGMAAAQLLKQGKKVVVTAPRLATLSTLFKHAAQTLEPNEQLKDRLECEYGTIQFVAPDQLAHNPTDADIIMVDEAAAIPSALLSPIVANHPKTIFATTIHGYEGTGQGFRIRFKALLDKNYPRWQELKLYAPIRWAEDDPLEELINHCLLLDVDRELIPIIPSLNEIDTSTILHEQLMMDEGSLQQLFALLTDAHYRTTPLDLRHMLEGPNLMIYQSTFDGLVVAAAIIASEGGFPEELDDEVYLGKRRPRGHLLPQTLCSQMSIGGTTTAKYRRIIRIAVAPELQHQGIGSQLLSKIIEDAHRDGVDHIGSSFGATSELLDFWHKLQFSVVRIGATRSTSSGTHAALMILPLTELGDEISGQADYFFQSQIPQQLDEPLADLEDEIKGRLSINPETPIDPQDDERLIRLFVDGHQSYENVLGSLVRGSAKLLGSPDVLPDNGAELIKAKLLNHSSWGECAEQFQLSGRKAVIKQLRQCFAQYAL